MRLFSLFSDQKSAVASSSPLPQLDTVNAEAHCAGRHAHRDLIASPMVEERLCDGRLDRDFALCHIGLVGTHYGVGHGAVVADIGEGNAAQQSYAVGLEQGRVDDACILQHALQETDAPQQATLLALGGMVLEVFAEVALVARFCNGVAHTGEFCGFKVVEFVGYLVEAFL